MSKSRLDTLKKRARAALSGIEYDYGADTTEVADEGPLRVYSEFDDEDEVKPQIQPVNTPDETIFQKALREFLIKCDDEKCSDNNLEADVIFFECVKYFYVNHIKAKTANHIAKLDFNASYCQPLAQYPKMDLRETYLAIYSNLYNPWITMENFSQDKAEEAKAKKVMKNLKKFFTKSQCLLVLQLTRSLPFTDDRELGVVIKNLALARKFAGDKKDDAGIKAILSHPTYDSQQKFNALINWVEDECLKSQNAYYLSYFQRDKLPGDYTKHLNLHLDHYDYERTLHLTLEDIYTICDEKGVHQLTHIFPDLNPRRAQPLQKGKKSEYHSFETVKMISLPDKQLLF